MKLDVLKPLAVLALITTVGCSGDKSQPNVELIQDMMDQSALKAQDYEPGDVMKSASRLPPEGTVPVGYKPYPYHLDPVAAGKNLKNPLAGEMSPEVLDLGRTKFNTYCMMCHGEKALGDGPVAAKMPLKPPSLLSEKVRTFNDANIYHIITDGQGVMASYAYQLVNEKDRWAIVNYIRSLQKLSK